MRPLFAILLVVLACGTPFVQAQEASVSSAASAEAEAVRKYPALGVAGTEFNREFVARVKSAGETNPAFLDDAAWPVTLADEVAGALPPAAQQAPVSAVPVNWYVGYSAETFATLPAALKKLDREALDYDLLSAAIFHATNAARRTQKLRPLVYLPALRETAWGHSRDMATLGFFSHQNPRDPAKATPALRLEAQGLATMAMGENISSLGAKGYTYWGYARAVVAQWMKSPGHRANILNARYTHLGCGAHACGCPNSHMLATQNFAFPTGTQR